MGINRINNKINQMRAENARKMGKRRIHATVKEALFNGQCNWEEVGTVEQARKEGQEQAKCFL